MRVIHQGKRWWFSCSELGIALCKSKSGRKDEEKTNYVIWRGERANGKLKFKCIKHCYVEIKSFVLNLLIHFIKHYWVNIIKRPNRYRFINFVFWKLPLMHILSICRTYQNYGCETLYYSKQQGAQWTHQKRILPIGEETVREGSSWRKRLFYCFLGK